MIRSIAVRGNQRLEPETIRSYANLAPGQNYSAETLDAALKDLYATELFSDVVITGAETGNIVITVQENPVINRIVLEGNKRIKDDKILPEIKLKPREIFTRSKVRADVERIIELYKRQGRFAARVEPKVVNLEQNRVDLVFEVYEGDKSKVRSINIIGNDAFGDDRLRKEMYTRQAGGVLGFLKSNDSYDPDRLAADQQKLRAFYLTRGLCRLPRRLRARRTDARPPRLRHHLRRRGRPALQVRHDRSRKRAARSPAREDQDHGQSHRGRTGSTPRRSKTPSRDLNEEAGNLGYAFADINPAYNRDAEKRVMGITFRVGETPRTYVERIDIQGNTSDSRQGHPARVPHQRRRCLQRAEGQAVAGSSSVARLFPGESRDQADRRLDAGPCRPGRQCRREVDRRASAVGWLFQPREVHPRFLDRPAELHGQGPGA